MADLRDPPRPGSRAHPRRATWVVERVLDGELVLYDPATQRVHVLNATAAFAWTMCDGGHTADDIVATLASQYPDSRRQIEDDVVEILRRFWDEGLIGE